MSKAEKVETVRDLKDRFENSSAAVLTEFKGLKVSEMKELRRTLADSGGEFKVVKNTLSRIAAREAELEDLLPLLEGSTAIAFVTGDPVAAAKGLDAISKKYPALVIKGGILDGAVLDAGRAQSLAKVASREVLLAQLAGLLQSPLQKLVFLLSAPVRQLGYALGALKEQREGEAPAVAETAAQPVAEETQTPSAPDAAAETPAEATPETLEAPAAEAPPESPVEAPVTEAGAPADAGPDAGAPTTKTSETEESPAAAAGDDQTNSPE